MALDIRRNLGNIAGRHASAMVVDNIDKTTVHRHEVRCANALLAASRNLHVAHTPYLGASARTGILL